MNGWHVIPDWSDLGIILGVGIAVLVGFVIVIEIGVGLRALWRLFCQSVNDAVHKVIDKVRSKRDENENGAHQGLGACGDEASTEDVGRATREKHDVYSVLASGGLDAQPAETNRQTAVASSAGPHHNAAPSQRTGRSASAVGSWAERPPQGLSLHDELAWRREHEQG